MRLMHNLQSLNVYREHTKIMKKQSSALNNISSGNKVNSAKDSPNVLASSEKMRMQIRGLQMSQRNVQDGVSMLQTSEGGLDNITSILQRIRQLTVQSGGAASSEDKETIQNEIGELIAAVDDFAKNTEFNGVRLLSNSNINNNKKPEKFLQMPVGANPGENVKIPIFNLAKDSLGVLDEDGSLQNGKSLKDIDITREGGLDEALSIIDASVDTVLSISSKYGALENRFESSYEKLDEIYNKVTGAESNLRDADIAEEMIEYTKSNLLMDAGHAMMVQSNKFPQEILRILENVRSR